MLTKHDYILGAALLAALLILTVGCGAPPDQVYAPNHSLPPSQEVATTPAESPTIILEEEPIVQEVPEVKEEPVILAENCAELGLLEENQCSMCADIPGIECVASEAIGHNQFCFECAAIPEKQEEAQADAPEVVPEIEPVVEVEAEIEPEQTAAEFIEDALTEAVEVIASKHPAVDLGDEACVGSDLYRDCQSCGMQQSCVATNLIVFTKGKKQGPIYSCYDCVLD